MKIRLTAFALILLLIVVPALAQPTSYPLTIDNGDFVFYDCAYEELLQSLGPINDTDMVPWTMFNDQVSMGFFDIYDQFILNILYDNRVRAGMTRKEMKALLPEILPSVREWIARKNNLPAP